MSTEAEARLQKLFTANEPQNRALWAREWKKGSGLVVGVLCTYVPVEVLVAAGIMPWRVSGTWTEKIDDALVIRSANSCAFCNHVLQSVLDGDMDFLDGVVATTWEQDLIRLWDVWLHLGKSRFNHILHLPHYPSDETTKYYAGEIAEFVAAVEKFVGKKIRARDLDRAIKVCNRRRSLMMEVYQLRRREVPPLSGAEMVGLTVAGTLMPVEQFNQEVEELLPYIRERRASLTAFTPRVMVSSDFADNPVFVEAIESAGCVAAMDDFDTGSRYYWRLVEVEGRDRLTALARRYLGRTGTARMITWQDQIEQAARWAKEYNIHGVIELSQRYSRSREMRRPFFLERMKQAGVPAISLERDYIPGNLGQLKNRVQAFLEMVAPVV